MAGDVVDRKVVAFKCRAVTKLVMELAAAEEEAAALLVAEETDKENDKALIVQLAADLDAMEEARRHHFQIWLKFVRGSLSPRGLRHLLSCFFPLPSWMTWSQTIKSSADGKRAALEKRIELLQVGAAHGSCCQGCCRASSVCRPWQDLLAARTKSLIDCAVEFQPVVFDFFRIVSHPPPYRRIRRRRTTCDSRAACRSAW